MCEHVNCYIGKTKRNLETRLKEHFLNIKYKDIEKSAVAHHFLITQHKVENEAKLLQQAEKPLELTIWKKYLHKKIIIFNFDIPDEKNLISKYIKPLKTEIWRPVEESDSWSKAEDKGL